VYFFSQFGQVSWSTLFLSYLFWAFLCFVVRRFSIVLLAVNVTLTFVFLNSFVMSLVSLPMYVNFAHLFFYFWSSCVLLFSLPILSQTEVSYLLLFKICCIMFFSFYQKQKKEGGKIKDEHI
jgi:hypothetical protein